MIAFLNCDRPQLGGRKRILCAPRGRTFASLILAINMTMLCLASLAADESQFARHLRSAASGSVDDQGVAMNAVPAGYSGALSNIGSASASGGNQQAAASHSDFSVSPWPTLELPSWLGESRLRPLPSEAGPQTLLRWNFSDVDELPTPKLEEALKTDRPDFTEASTTVGKGALQIEFGYTYTFNREGNSTLREHSLGEVLLRYGVLADWLELRLAVLPINLKQSDGTHRLIAQGVEDLYLGTKLALTAQDDWLPEMALTPQITVPTGSSIFNGGDVHYGVNWLYGWDITDEWSFAGSTQFNRGLDNFGQHFVEFAQSFTVGHSFTETVGGYAEWFVLMPTRSEVGPTEHYFNGGFTWKLSNDIQYDIRGGAGLNAAAADYFIGTGLALRFH